MELALLADDPTGDSDAASVASLGSQDEIAASSSSDTVGLVPSRDMLAMAYNNMSLSGVDAERVSFLAISQGVSQVSTLEKLQELHAMIASFPHGDHQTGLLRQVMLRIHALPLQDRPQALSDWRAAVGRLALEGTLPELPRLEDILRHPNASAAVLGGEDVGDVATAFNVNLPDAVSILRAHEFEQFGALRGLPWQPSVRTLEFRTIHSVELNSAGALMRRGEPATEVAANFVITNPDAITALELQTIDSDAPNTAGAEMLAGRSATDVAARFGITTTEGRTALEMRTINSDAPNTAGATMLANGNVQEVAEEFGITTAAGIRELQRRSITPNT